MQDMNWFPAFPLKYKLIMISLLTSGAALLLACAAFVGYEQIMFRHDMTRDLGVTAQMIGMNSTAALAFDDPSSANATLTALNAHPHIVAAWIYDSTGNVFAYYLRNPGVVMEWPVPGDDGERFAGEYLDVSEEIRFAGDRLGTIYLRSDLERIRERWVRYGMIVGIVFLASILMAWLVAARLQRVISAPILDLAAVAYRVAEKGDFSIRAEMHGEDEIGRLTDNFNEMLSHIGRQNAQLVAAHNELEKRVEERTIELKRAKEEAEVERARLRFIFEFIPVGISLLSGSKERDSSYMVNDAYLRICGVSREQGVEATFKSLTHPADRKQQDILQKRLEAREIDQYSIEKRYLKENGETVWVVFSTRRKYYSNGNAETLTTVIDVTDLKRAQEETAREHERFRFIFESLPVGVAWTVSGQEETRIVNPAFARITGVPQEACHNLDLYRLATHPDDWELQQKLRQKMATGDIDTLEIEKRYRNGEDSSYRWAVLTVREVGYSDSGEVQELSTVVDITSRKEAEAELANTHRRLLEASRQAGMAEVATSVLHNVGNVLNSVNVSATVIHEQVKRSKSSSVAKLSELLSRRENDLAAFLTEDPQGRKVPGFLRSLAEHLTNEQSEIIQELNTLRTNVDHIKEIVSMQQTYAKISGVTETISVIDLVEDALNMSSGSLLRHQVKIVRDFRIRPSIVVERHRVLQILINVFRNAIIACDEADVAEKTVSVQVDGTDEIVEISVTDNGVGISAENLSRIFRNGFTTRKDGHGFGLHSGAIAASEVGGRLRVHSDGLGKGATFILELPYSPPEES